MLRPHLLFTLSFVCFLVAHAPGTDAQPLPDPRFTTFDPVLVGNQTGNPLGGLQPGFDVVIRDVFNVPIEGRAVILDFTGTPIRLSAVQNSGTTLDCVARTLSRVTDLQGRVKFAARIGKFENANAVLVSAGVPLGVVKARSTDIDGLDGRTGLGDFAVFANNFLNLPGAQETDFDQNGTTGLGDFAIMYNEFLLDMPQPYCP